MSRCHLIASVLAATAIGCVGAEEILPAAEAYVLVVDDATLEEQPGVSYSAPAPDSVGPGQRVHLLLSVTETELRAWVTPPFGEPREYRADLGDGRGPFTLMPGDPIALTGETRAMDVRLQLQRITLDASVDEGGELRWTGRATFEGTETLTSTDVFTPYDVGGTLTGRVDDEAPAVRVERATDDTSVDRPLYPWEGFSVHASEPTDLSGDDLIVARTTHEAASPGGDEPTTRLTVLPASWWPAGDTLSVEVLDTYRDRNGVAGLPLSETLATFGDLPPAPVIGFDDGTSPSVEIWGGDAVMTVPTFAECTGGCLALSRPLRGQVGFFARLADATGISGVRARIRVLSMASDVPVARAGSYDLRIEIAEEGSPDATVLTDQVSVPEATLSDAYVGDSGWIEVGADLATTVDSIGVGFELSGYHDGVAPMPLQPPAVVLVDSVEAF